MARKNIRKKTRFARWLTRLRKHAKLTQAEAAERMKQLGKGVTPETWSRWESGVRLPPRTRIDAVADTVKVRREVARRQAGYNAPIKRSRKRPARTLEAMLRSISGDLKTEDKVLRIYALGSGYLDNADPQFNIKEMQRIARLFDDLKTLSASQRAEAWERISQLFEDAKEMSATSIPVDKATLIFEKLNPPAVTLGTEVSIEYSGEWYSYMVKKIEKKDGKLVATIHLTDS